MLECVINISEGRDDPLIDEIGTTAGADLLDIHRCRDHNRSVLTVVGEEAPRAITRRAVERLDLGSHEGAHPRLGVVDVVPFVPLTGSSMGDAITARDRFARWAADALGVPCFLYGPASGRLPTRILPEIRRTAFGSLPPDLGPDQPHSRAGAICVGARPVLVAYNLWLRNADPEVARQLAAGIRSPQVRALGLVVGDQVQVSMNLIDPPRIGPDRVYDDVSHRAVAMRAEVARAELVGLLPRSVLHAIDPTRWDELGLGEDCTIEYRLERRRIRLAP